MFRQGAAQTGTAGTRASARPSRTGGRTMRLLSATLGLALMSIALPALVAVPASADTTAPVVTISGTTPTSPNPSTTPLVYGTVTATGDTTVQIFANSACSGPPLATGTGAAFTSPGIQVSVTPGSTTTFWANTVKNGATFACSTTSATYTAGVVTSFNWSAPQAITYPTALSAAQLDAVLSPAGAASNGTVTYSPALGTVLGAGSSQTLSVSFTPNAGSVYLASKAQVTLTVNQAPQTISFTNPGNHTYGDAPFTLAASGGGSGNPVTFTLASGSTGCSLSGTNNATVTITSATATGSSCVINANQAGSSNYLPATQVQQSFTVAKATPTVTWAAPAAITYGATLASALDAQASVPGTYAYTLNGNPVTASTVPDAGTSQPLAVTFTPSDSADYTTATASQTITVNQASQTVSVNPLGSHTYGDAPFTVSASSTNPALPLTYTASGACSDTNHGTTVTITSAGSCSVTVSQAGNNDYQAATPVPVSTTIAQYQPTVSWTAPAPITYGTALSTTQLGASLAYTIDASATAPTAGSWTYTLSDGTVLSPGSVLGAGSYPTTATWTPDPGQSAINYLPATNTVTITVAKATPQLTWPDQSVVYPTALSTTQLDAAVSPLPVGTTTVTPTGNIAYTYDGGSTDATGQILAAGGHTLTATFTPDTASAANFTSSALTVGLSVAQGTQTITFASQRQTVTYGDTPFTVSALGGGSTSAVSFSSLTPGVCSVGTASLQGDGSYAAMVTIIAAGDCIIAADQAGDDNYLPAPEVTQDETVAKATPSIQWATPADITYGTALGSTQLDASVAQPGAGGYFTYTLADGTTAAGGAVLDAGQNQALIATFHDTDGNYNDATATVSINVDPASQTITFPAIADHTYGDADFAVTATGGGSGNSVTFTATGDCTVSTDGTVVHITGAGSCSITANQEGNDNYLAAPAVTNTFAITKADQTIGSITPSVTTFTYGDPPFTVSATATSGLDVSFSASGACTNSGSSVTITAAGDCTVSAIQPGDANYNSAPSVSQVFSVAKADQAISGFSLPATATYLDAPIVTSPSGGGSGQPVVLSTSSTACTVTGLTVYIAHAGTCVVTASQDGNGNYNAAPDVSQTMTVQPYTPTISWSPASVTYGTVLGPDQLDASLQPAGVVAGAFTYAGTDTNSNPVDLTTALHAGTYSVVATFTPTDTSDVNTVSKTATITVNKADQTITFNSISGTHTYGDPPFVVSATATSGLPVAFSASADTAADCSVADNSNSSGTVTIVHAGGCTVVASQAGNGDYNAATPVSQGFTAAQATPAITWTTPADITYGTALDATQLDATATFNNSAVAGAMAYSPPAGTVLGAGTQTLGVQFTPTDANDFTAASGTVSINVLQAPQAISFAAIADHTYGDPAFTVTATGGESGQPVTFTASGSCTVTPAGTVTITGAGTCSVTASQAGTSNYAAATDVTQSFNVARAPQSVGAITPSVSTFTYGDPNFTVSATGGGSGNPVTFAASGACSSGGTNGATIAITSAGDCNVTASQAGSTNYLDATPVTQTFTVAKAGQAITFPAVSFGTVGAAQGSTATLTATASSGLPVVYTASGTCSVSGSTLSLSGAAGTCSVTASQPGNGNFNAAAPVTQAFTTYNFGGFAPPVRTGLAGSKGGPSGTPAVSFKQGSTIPVKFQFLSANGASVQLSTPPLFILSPAATNSNPATAGNTYQWDATGQQYIYNLGTKNMTAGTTYTVGVSLSSTGPSWSTQIVLSK